MRCSANQSRPKRQYELAKSLELRSDLRPLILAAHPDDEAVGASAVIMRCPETTVVYLTDGAPRDRNLRSPDVIGPRERYVRTRVLEANAALRVAGIEGDQSIFLGVVDQEAVFEIAPRALYFASLLERLRPDIVITHPYEGGHPDHDAAALIARLSLNILTCADVPVPDLVEMTSYHARDGALVVGAFLDRSAQPSMVIELSSEELGRKRAMLNAYGSQWRVLQSFDVSSETLRIPPKYDFRLPPHDGKLWYECLGWRMTGRRWRSLAAGAILEVEQQCA